MPSTPAIPRGAWLLVIAVALGGSAAPLRAAEAGAPDSLEIYSLPPVVVTAEPATPPVSPRERVVTGAALRVRSQPDAAALAPLLPSVRLALNSRGEAQFMLRGASERHLLVSQDGIPLNLAWDERSDLELQPAEALGAVRARRGVPTLLAGTGALAGTVELSSRAAPASGAESLVDLGVGEAGARRGTLLHARRLGRWGLLLSLAQQERDGWLRPAAADDPHHQPDSRLRLNSDLTRRSAFLTLGRDLPRGGRLSLHAGGSHVDKGVPPETYRSKARFWRYPDSRRALFGAGLDQPLDADGRWRLGVTAAADLSHTEIRVFDDASYSGPALVPGVEHETDDDRTLHLRALLARQLGAARLSLASELRDARHREALALDDPTLDYAQRRVVETLELDLPFGAGWSLRGGLAWLRASTPSSGDKPPRDPDVAWDWLAGLGRDFAGRGRLELSLSQRSRFPALRELYSGALGQFIPNPALAPERQTLVELGLRRERGRLGLEADVFAAWLDGGIEKEVVSDADETFRRANVDAIRSLGAELELRVEAGGGVSASAHWLQLHARRRIAGDYTGRVEDRPAAVGALSLNWRGPRGLELGAETGVLGARFSADATDDVDGLRPLPTQGRLALLAAWRRYLGAGSLRSLELRIRVDNVFDSVVESQTGLVEPGRSVQLGLRLDLGA